MSKEENVEWPAASVPQRTSENDALDVELELQVNIRLKLDEVVEIQAKTLRASASRTPSTHELCELAGRIYDARRTRNKMMDGQLFGEPGWDMLLALYCLPKRGLLMSVSALSYCADIPQTTGYRWQALLTSEGLIERGPREVDARRQIVRLTQKGRTMMSDYLTRLFYCGLPLASAEKAAD